MQVLSIYLVDEKGQKALFGSTTSIQNAQWAEVNLKNLKKWGFLHSTVKEIKVIIEDLDNSKLSEVKQWL